MRQRGARIRRALAGDRVAELREVMLETGRRDDLEDPAARAAIGVQEGERVVSIVSVGVPAEMPAPKTRQSSSAVTCWTA